MFTFVEGSLTFKISQLFPLIKNWKRTPPLNEKIGDKNGNNR